jgi:hypothetical protein
LPALLIATPLKVHYVGLLLLYALYVLLI